LTACGVPRPSQVEQDRFVRNFSKIDATFTCPEALPDDRARIAAFKSYDYAFQKMTPPPTQALIRDWLWLLKRHGCTTTLAGWQEGDPRLIKIIAEGERQAGVLDPGSGDFPPPWMN
jgi:hypothetical protein